MLPLAPCELKLGKLDVVETGVARMVEPEADSTDSGGAIGDVPYKPRLDVPLEGGGGRGERPRWISRAEVADEA